MPLLPEPAMHVHSHVLAVCFVGFFFYIFKCLYIIEDFGCYA